MGDKTITRQGVWAWKLHTWFQSLYSKCPKTFPLCISRNLHVYFRMTDCVCPSFNCIMWQSWMRDERNQLFEWSSCCRYNTFCLFLNYFHQLNIKTIFRYVLSVIKLNVSFWILYKTKFLHTTVQKFMGGGQKAS